MLVGVGLTVWWRSRRDVLATVEAQVQAVAQLELRALAEGDTDLYRSLQDDAAPGWREPPEAPAALEPLLLALAIGVIRRRVATTHRAPHKDAA